MTPCCEKTLVYKRTHKGDPNESGIFGICDCMGKVRDWDFDAVIGVGGKCPDAGCEEIAHKVNWIGKVAHREKNPPKRGSDVTFDFFCLYDEQGKSLEELAPNLHKYMFKDKHVRAVLSQNLPCNIQEEIAKILRAAEKCGCPKKIVPIGKYLRKVDQQSSGCCK
jgi:hypothetical protein